MILNFLSVLHSHSRDRNKVFIYSQFGEFDYNLTYDLICSFSPVLRKVLTESSKDKKEVIYLVKGDGEIAHILFLLTALSLQQPFIPFNRAWARSEKIPTNLSGLIIVECEEDKILLNGQKFSILNLIERIEESIEEIQPKETANELEVLACCFPTSGTTGNPKMIAVSNFQLMKGAILVTRALGINSADIVTGMLSLDFDYGLNQLLGTIVVNASYVCCQLSTATRETIANLKSRKPTVLAVMPFLVDTFFPALSAHRLDTVRLVTSSGGQLIPKHRSVIHSICPNATIIPMYGLSEAFRATISTPQIDARFPDSVGLPIGDTEISIRNQEGQLLPPDTIGEIWQSGGCLSWGYWHDIEATRARFIDDLTFPNKKWLKSGDLGYLNSEGVLFIVGRVSFQIKKYGHRVSIDEVEQIISSTLSGLVCVAVPIEITQTESDFDVFVEAPEERVSMIAREIRHSLSRELWPRKLFCIDSIPLNIYGGKPDRQALLNLRVEENAKNVHDFRKTN